MKLKFRYDSESEIPEKFRELYEEKDGVWTLQVDGAADRDKLKEFRDNNTKLNKRLEAFGDLEPEEIENLRAENKTLKADNDKLKKQAEKGGKGGDGGVTQEEVEQRLAAQKAEFDRQLKAATDERDTLKTDLERVVVEQAITSAAAKAGVRKTAIEDVMRRGKEVFRLENGKPVPYRPNGDKVYGKDQIELMTPDEWLEGLQKDAPHLFDPSQGGGAAAGASGGGKPKGGVNPWKRESRHLGEQARILKENPDLARRLMEEAKATNRIAA